MPIIGTRGLSGVQRLFLASVELKLMSSLEIDILAVPPTAWETWPAETAPPLFVKKPVTD